MPRDVGQNWTQTKGPGGCPWPRALARFSTQQAPYDDGLCYRSPQPQTWKTHAATRDRPDINVPQHMDALPGGPPLAGSRRGRLSHVVMQNHLRPPRVP